MRLIQNPEGPFWVWDQDHLGQILESGAFWDGQLLPFLQEALDARPGCWAIDLGASVGVFTVWLAKRCPQVIAVEMHPGTCELLQRNILGHGVMGKVRVYQLGAYDQDCELMLAPPEYVGWPIPLDLNQTPNASSIALVRATGGAPLYVRGIRVDTLVPPDAPIGVIKVDVQGCDLRALHGLTETIARCRPLILWEFEGGPSGWHGDTWADYQAFFDARGYDIQPVGSPMDYVARPR